jgi:hypothetical protein
MGFFLGGGNGQAITRAGIHFDDFAGGMQFILLLQNEAREVGGIFQVGNNDALNADAKALEDTNQEVVGERTFFGCLPQEHADNGTHLRFHVDDKDFLVVADEKRAAAVRGKNSTNLHWHDFVLHAPKFIGKIKKDKSTAAFWLGGRQFR